MPPVYSEGQGERELTDDPARRHDWKRDEFDGDVNIFEVAHGFHNGPRCERCGEGFCHHCEPDCYRYVCPAISEGPQR